MAQNSVWQAPPSLFSLSDDDVHVWRASLNCGPARIQRIQQVLSDDERKRSQNFHFTKDKQSFIVARSLLRIILSKYLHTPPRLIEFCYGPHGKPALASNDGGELQFNLSHSNGMLLMAVSKNRPIGVDVEYMRNDPTRLKIADRFFSPREVSKLRSLPDVDQKRAFYTCWTRKEAYIKAKGMGLSLPLDQFDVSLIPGEAPALLWNASDPEEVSQWMFYDLPPIPGFATALVVKSPPVGIEFWQLVEELFDEYFD
jgi:4'-phosphopantetheinyl transferase